MNQTSSGIDWELVRGRLRASEKALEEALSTSAERMQAVFRRRAAELAKPSRDADRAASQRTPVLIFRLASERYGIELSALAGVTPYKGCTRVPGAPAQFPGVINLRGELRPVLELRLLLTGTAGEDATGYLLIPRRGQVGLKVDEVEDMREIRAEEISLTGPSRYVRGLAPGGLMLLDLEVLLAAVSSPKEELRPL